MTEVQEFFPVVEQFVEKGNVVQLGSKSELNKYMNKDSAKDMEMERKADSFAMTADAVKKFEDSFFFPWQARGVERIVGL